jgi:hypothetical protein
MNNQRSNLVAVFSLLAGITGCAVAPDDQGDTSSVEQLTYVGDLGGSLGTPVTTGNTIGLTQDFIPSCVTFSVAPQAVHTWTAPASGTFTFTTAGSNYDTVLELLVFNTLASLGCNDDSGGLQSSVTAAVTAGQTLLVVVGGFFEDAGQFRVNIAQTALQAVPAISESERQAIDDATARKLAAVTGR